MTWHPDIPLEYRDQIMTGDARVLAERIPDASVDLVLTDPPFGLDFKYDGYNDPEAYPDLVRWIATTCDRIIKPGGLCFVFVAQPKLRHVWSLFPEDSRIFAACKNFVQMRPIPVQFAYDPVIFWQKPGRLISVYRGRDYHIGNTANTNNRGNGEAKWHECPRPIDTCSYIIGNFSPFGGVVCDLFAGSGTTAVAAKQLHRHCIGFEVRAEMAERARQRVALTQAMHPVFLEEQQTMDLTNHPG